MHACDTLTLDIMLQAIPLTLAQANIVTSELKHEGTAQAYLQFDL